MGWRRRAGVGVVAAATGAASMFVLLPLALQGAIRGLQLTVNACVWLAASLSTGMDAWTIVAVIMRAAADALSTPRALGIMGALGLVAALALYGLRQLLGIEEESSR
jgi:hypothetical protein